MFETFARVKSGLLNRDQQRLFFLVNKMDLLHSPFCTTKFRTIEDVRAHLAKTVPPCFQRSGSDYKFNCSEVRSNVDNKD